MHDTQHSLRASFSRLLTLCLNQTILYQIRINSCLIHSFSATDSYIPMYIPIKAGVLFAFMQSGGKRRCGLSVRFQHLM